MSFRLDGTAAFSSALKALFTNANRNVLDRARTLPASYQAHFDKSRQEILFAAQGVEGSALILGVGSAHDIPLDHLVRQFKTKVTLVDADSSLIEDVLKQIAPENRHRVHFCVADLTGSLKEISNRIDAIVLASNSREEVWKVMDSIQRQPPDFEKHDFVCSSMVISQLSWFKNVMIEQALVQKFGKTTFVYPVEDSLKVESAHLTDLQKWSKDRVYLSSDVQVQSGNRTTLLPASETLKKVPQFFNIKNTNQWSWQVINPSLQQIRFVNAMTLTKKKGV